MRHAADVRIFRKRAEVFERGILRNGHPNLRNPFHGSRNHHVPHTFLISLVLRDIHVNA